MRKSLIRTARQFAECPNERAAIESGIARNPVDPQSVAENLRKRLS